MKNIERKYAYHDDGVFPAVGEDGVTYLTLYSSNAGNTYDGWIWDPDRVHYSETERTFGYRYPGDENYCWDDEVTVDLSNAQNRQESSEYETGRITSFNTNVSKFPIVLQDVDVTGLTEEERESKATMVLFTAIPLIKSAYIHGEIEISMKMNISPDNTDGNVRVEAFYILNDESDRTMRPNPVNHYTVTKANEYHTMRLLYYNPAVNHEQNNYIGVKLVVSGGTAEIGISDDPDYGDAIITVASNGMDGDRVFNDNPVELRISGNDTVPYGYLFDPYDYTVIARYADGTEFEVTGLCSYIPIPGTEIITQPVTITAYYMNLVASMDITIAPVDHIELVGRTYFYDSYTFTKDDYTVWAYFDDEHYMDVTDNSTFDISEGTVITQNTIITATYEPSFMSGSIFTDTLNLVEKEPGYSVQTNGLIYTAYDDDETDALIVVTGNSLTSTIGNEYWRQQYAVVRPIVSDDDGIGRYIKNKHMQGNRHDGREMTYRLEWQAKGDISGIMFNGSSALGSPVPEEAFEDDVSFFNLVNYFCKKTIGFNKVKIIPRYKGLKKYDGDLVDPITIDLRNQKYLTNSDIPFLYKINFNDVENVKVAINSVKMAVDDENEYINYVDYSYMFCNCWNLVNISFLNNWPLSLVRDAIEVSYMFFGCKQISDYSDIKMWYMPKVRYAWGMFAYSGIRYFPFKQLYIGSQCTYRPYGEDPTTPIMIQARYMFARCKNLSEFPASAFLAGDSVHSYNMRYMFLDCYELSDISKVSSWSGLEVLAIGMFCNACVTSGAQNVNGIRKLYYAKYSTHYEKMDHYYEYDPQGQGTQYDYDTYPPFIGRRGDYAASKPYTEPNVSGVKKSDYYDNGWTAPEWVHHFQAQRVWNSETSHYEWKARLYEGISGSFKGISDSKVPGWYLTLKEEAENA